MNLRCHVHVLPLDGVYVETVGAALEFYPAPAPSLAQLQALAGRVAARVHALV